MSNANLEFDQLESQIVGRADNATVTRQRIWLSVLVPLVLVVLLLLVFWREAQPKLLLWLFVGYVIINIYEKVCYGFAVLGYKSVIRKLLARVKELEGQSGRSSIQRVE
jgi:hypothetical protein